MDDDQDLSAQEIHEFLMLFERLSNVSDMRIVIVDGSFFICKNEIILIEGKTS